MPTAGTPVGQAIAEYVRAGLSVLPVGKDKAPNFQLLPKDGTTGRATWAPYARSIPSPAETAAWVQRDPNTGIGIICGQVSGGITGLDVDDQGFADWIVAAHRADLLDRTWSVRTGSGKLHVYVKSRKPVTSTVLKAADGRKLADVRSDGRPPNGPEYLVAPPSLHPVTGKPYETLTGSPDRIAGVTDALHLFTVLANQYAAAVQQHAAAGPGAALYADTSISPPLDAEARERLANRLKAFDRKALPQEMRDAIQNGAEPGEGLFKSADSHSAVDYRVIKTLRGLGFTRSEIRDCFATWGIGEKCYRNRNRRGSHGNGYLIRTIDNADRELQKEREQAAQAAGENFTIVDSVKYLSDPPYFEITLRVHATNSNVDVTLQWDEMLSEKGFKSAVGRQTDFWPRFRSVHISSQRAYEEFLDLVIQMSEKRPVPEEATTMGYLREQICRALLSYRIEKQRPAQKGAYHVGFRDDKTGMIYFKGTQLLIEVAQAMQQKAIPDPSKVWFILKGMGATEVMVSFGTGRDRLWAVPIKAVERR